jgi:aminopeptidase N
MKIANFTLKTADTSDNKTFAFPGSTNHYLPLLYFNIEYMWLKIKPNLESRTLSDCEQRLKIVARRDIEKIDLDIAEMKIHKITSSHIAFDEGNFTNNNGEGHIKELQFEITGDKLIIHLGENLSEGGIIYLKIHYSAGYYYVNGKYEVNKPKSGFYFIENDEYHRKIDIQMWTQGESIESKYWFPCIDQPQVKYPRELEIIVPQKFVVISNGKIKYNDLQDQLGEEKTGDKLIRYVWDESHPNPAYLTSVVIGTFGYKEENYPSDDNNKREKIQLSYYWPTDIKEQIGIQNFQNTPNMIKTFEEYLYTNYPYTKYTQVAVENFEFGGMENTSCTTLTRDILFDERASLDYTCDDVISHELAHQWFGDLVTCKDWPHIWLNEGFATYFEALYWEASRGKDEYQYYMIQMADTYLDEANTLYTRPIVTKKYKHPDELFDSHSYKKGGCVLHMLRNYIGNDYLRKSLKNYLKVYGGKTAETDDLRKILEEVSGKDLGLFFDQWVYGSAGHPKLDIEFSKDSKNVKLKIVQNQEGDIFEFDLEIILFFSFNDHLNKEERIEKSIKISEKESEESFEIPKDKDGRFAKLTRFSIDSQFKILKEINSIKASEEIFINQIEKSETIFEKVHAIRALSDKFSDNIVKSLKNIILKEDVFWGVSVEAANVLGSYKDTTDVVKTDKAYRALTDCFSLGIKHPKVRRAVVLNIGNFENEESVKLLEPLLTTNKDPSYFVEGEAATAIGKSSKYITDKTRKTEIISLLKDLSELTDTFRHIPARWAINGLKEFFKDDDVNRVSEIADFLINKSKYGNHDLVRRNAASVLGKYLRDKNKKVNQNIFDRLKELIKDERSAIRTAACTALSDPDAKPLKPDVVLLETFDELTFVAQHDIDGFTRRAAEVSLNIIRQWIKEWSETPLLLPIELIEKAVVSTKREDLKKQHTKMLSLVQKRMLESE